LKDKRVFPIFLFFFARWLWKMLLFTVAKWRKNHRFTQNYSSKIDVEKIAILRGLCVKIALQVLLSSDEKLRKADVLWQKLC
jgi:hypothetical protein